MVARFELVDQPEPLLPCPFCGGLVRYTRAYDDLSGWMVECSNICCVICPETDIYDTEDLARSAWNMRAG